MSNNQKFSSLYLKKNLLEAIDALGFKSMTKIQEKSLPHILNSKDVIAEAQTGSGKTLAFALGLLSKLDPNVKVTQSLVLCPTRELAEQVAEEIRKLARKTHNVKVLTLTGGTPFFPQAASLEHGAHCIVGTPGRVLDHLGKRTLNLSKVNTLVLDEADRMLEMGFAEDLERIVKRIPNERQTLLFSATFSDNIKELSSKLLKKSVHLKVEADSVTIDETFYEADEEKKDLQLASLLEKELPTSAVIFCNTKKGTEELANFLRSKGFACGMLHGDLDQRDRRDILMLFSQKSLSLLVATDVAARGIDISDVDLVVNFDLAKQPEVHVHRVGRTGRAGKDGKAFSLFTKREAYKVGKLEEYTEKSYKKVKASSLKLIGHKTSLKAPMVTLNIIGGKKNKIRVMDILGAMTNSSEIKGDDIGKINVFDFYSCVAVRKEKAHKAYDHLKSKPIKGRVCKVRIMG